MLKIRLSKQLDTRNCQFCLALQNDAVFMDFYIKENGCLILLRISFDGYGCCYPSSGLKELDSKSSKTLLNLIQKDNLNSTQTCKIISNYLKDNKKSLWEEALQEHQLI
ncbi:MAG: hypothetical protein HWD86_04925 [Kangiellaceae bacterium]|nr:hypothetical protein [Kangiellaceae bacterium]